LRSTDQKEPGINDVDIGMIIGCSLLENLFQENRHQDGNKVKHGHDNNAQAYLINPWMTEISLVPIGRFNEMLKAPEQAWLHQLSAGR
jgi:hypothetical protein